MEWLGEIPEGWELWKIAHAYLEIGSGTTPITDNQNFFEGEIPWITTSELRENIILETKRYLTTEAINTYTTLKKYPVGSIAIAMYGATIGRVGIFGIESTTNQACCVMPYSKVIFNKYLFYWLLAFKEEIIQLSSGGGQPNINQEKVSSLKVSCPTFFEQQTIAQFLDYETAKIDALIAKQEQLIALLKEKRQAVISHAVTKGLNPDAPMKDSGVEWLGQVPEHWEIWKLSHAYSTIGSGTTPPTVDQDLYDGDIPWVTTGELRENIIFDTSKKVSEATILNYPTLRKYPVGSVLIAMYGATIGRLGILGVEATTNQACCVLPFSKVIINKYTFYWLLAFKEEIIGLSSGGGQPNINQEKISNLRVSAPDIVEQKRIVEYLETIESKMEELIKKSLSSIQLLQERKTALISAAVTGKIDVRDWQPPTVS